MFVVYCMMHDTVMLQNYSQKNFLVGDSFWEELMSVQPNGTSMFFFLFATFPLRLFYWCYECMHTFFVVTVQFSAFFTIVFWLFLLFYTFFVYEKYEHHFNNITKMHKKLIDELRSLKKDSL
jgi:cbb3-type cytochrome oxidase subunit 3